MQRITASWCMGWSLSGGGLSDLGGRGGVVRELGRAGLVVGVHGGARGVPADGKADDAGQQRHHGQDEEGVLQPVLLARSEEHTSELQSPCNLVCRLLLEKKK